MCVEVREAQLGGKDAYEHIRQWFLLVAKQKGERVNKSTIAIPRFSVPEIGAIVGTSVQTVRNVLKQLKKEQFLKVEKNRMLLKGNKYMSNYIY